MSAQWFFQGGQCRRLFPMLEGGAGLVFQRWKVMKPLVACLAHAYPSPSPCHRTTSRSAKTLISTRSVTRRSPRGIGGGQNRSGGGGVTTGGQLVRVKRGSISESTGLFFRIGLPDGPGFEMHVLSTLGPTEAVGKKVRAGCPDLPFNRPFLMRGRGCAGNRGQNVVTGPFQEAAVEFPTLA